MDRLPLPQEDESGWSYDQFMKQAAPTSSGEAVSASFDLAWRDAGLQLYGRYAAKRDFEAQGAKKLTPDEANARYPGMPKPFREDVDPYVAQLIADQHEDKMKLQMKIENGPDDGWTQTKMFGAGIVAHLMDPLEFGAGAVTGWGVGGLLAKTAFGARLTAHSALAAQVSEHAALGIRTAENAVLAKTVSAQASEMALKKFGFSAAESFGGNIVQNIGQEAALANVQLGEHQEYDLHEGINNAIVTAAFGTLFHTAIKEGVVPGVKKGLEAAGTGVDFAMSSSRKLARNLFGKAPEADLAVVRTVVSQVDRGANPDVGPIVKSIAQETDVRPEDFPGKFTYEYKPITTVGKILNDAKANPAVDLVGKKFYVPAKPNPEFHATEKMQIGDERGIGTQMTDNPGVANVAANRSFSDGSGVVWEVDGSKLHPLELAAPVSEDLSPAYVKALTGIVDNPEEFVKQATHGDVLDAMWQAADEGTIEPQAIKDLQGEMKAKGYNSLLEDGSNVMGHEHRPHNLVTLLDDSVVEPKGYFETDPEIRKAPSEGELAQIAKDANDPLNDQFIDKEAYTEMKQEIEALDSEGSKDPMTEIDQQAKDYVEEIDSLEKQGLAEPEDIKAREEIKEMDLKLEEQHILAKALKYCVGA